MIKYEAGSISKIKPSNFKHNHTVSQTLKDIGKCCNVDHCDGLIRHWDPASGQMATYGIVNGVWTRTALTAGGKPYPKWQITPGDIVNRKGEDPQFVEQLLDMQSDCCGADCCGTNMIRLPDASGLVYEFGTENGVDIAPRIVTGVTYSGMKKFQTRTITKRDKPVKYWEDAIKCMSYGFNCCEGSLVLPDQSAAGVVHKITIVGGNLQIDEITGTIPAPTAAITTAAGTDVTPAVVTYSGTFPNACTVGVTVSVDGGGGVAISYTTTGSETAAEVALGMAAQVVAGATLSANGNTLEIISNTATTGTIDLTLNTCDCC